jgi:hypothetical protein
MNIYWIYVLFKGVNEHVMVAMGKNIDIRVMGNMICKYR